MNTSAALDLVQGALAAGLWLVLLLIAIRCSLAAIRGRWFLTLGTIKRLHGIFFGLFVVALFVWRAPELAFNQQYDSDESEFVALAHRLTVDGVGWRFGDVGTSGPLTMYVLGWAIPLGLPVDYFVGRLTEIACLLVTVFFLLKSTSLIVGRRQALLVIFSIVSFYLLAWDPEFVHYAAEDLPVALLAVATWLLLALNRKPKWTTALGLGVLLGAVPFTKLQATPLSAYFFITALGILGFCSGKRFITTDNRSRCMSALVAGTCIVPVAVMLPVISAGLWSKFMSRYVLFGLWYGPEDIFKYPATRLQVTVYLMNYVQYSLVGLLDFGFFATALKLLNRTSERDRSWFLGFAFAFGYLILTIAVILKPRNLFPHYLLLFVSPALIFVAWSVRGLMRGKRSDFFNLYRLALPILFFAICILPQVCNWSIHDRLRPRLSDRPTPDLVLEAIKTLSKPGDSIAIWGYAPEYFVESGRLSASRFTVMSSVQGKDYEPLRADFVADLEKSKPALFIDATGGGLWPFDNVGWVHPLEKARYTTYPPLADYINANYHLESQIQPPGGHLPVLLFLRNE
jgi:hypothetical protein